ncbi:MAG: hypothetical protein EOP85_19910 [Verrucomicrobiaceae bacterium]|nr:MAG: hypothetical protein EOP85_19910 [Verrucomicrobiaceae bacterium]
MTDVLNNTIRGGQSFAARRKGCSINFHDKAARNIIAIMASTTSSGVSGRTSTLCQNEMIGQ